MSNSGYGRVRSNTWCQKITTFWCCCFGAVVWKFAKMEFLWNVVEDSDLEVTQDEADFSLYPLAPLQQSYDLWRPGYKFSLAVFRFLEGFLQKKGTESWHFGIIFWFCMDSSPFLKREIQKNGQNPNTLNKSFGFARILCCLHLQEPFMKTKLNL